MPDNSPTQDIPARVDEYVTHLTRMAQVFTDHARDIGLGVRLDANGAIAAVRNGTGIARVMRFCERQDESGVLHDAQLMTALNCIGELLTAPTKTGLVLGAMQSGKTTTSLALQFAGPIVYLLTGRCLYPIYLITSQTSQEDQTKIEITRFLDFYGELTVTVDGNHSCTLIEYVKKFTLDPVFEFSPTINTYREHVLKKALPDTMMGPRLDDFIQRRAPGESIKRVADLCKRANAKGYAPLLIVDEPQFGASDHIVKVEDGVEQRPCVLLQIFNKIDEALGDNAADRVFIGLSATPYELHDVQAVWKVPQYLTSAYTGFNYFGGKVIDAQATVTPPRTMSFSAFGKQIGLPALERVNLNAYDAEPEVFERFARKIRYTRTQEEYRREVEQSLRAAIIHMARNSSRTDAGICIRLFNNNIRSHRLIENLRLPIDQIDVIEYFGSDHRGHSVKRAIRQRPQSGRPFVVVVTNRARMGDAFPREVEWFLEFSNKAANLNGLLQGLLGRACGYGKRSTVIMSEENASLVEGYKSLQGGYFYKTSRHSTIVGPYRRGAPTTLIRVRRDMSDPVIKRFFERLDEDVVKPNVKQGTATVSATRAKGDRAYRVGPVLKIAEELNLFDHLETAEVRKKHFPTYPGFRLARAGDEVSYSRNPEEKLRYTLEENGDCRFTFRELSGNGDHGGARSRGYGKRDASDPARAGDTLEPQVNLRKFDPVTGKDIDDKVIDGVKVDRKQRQAGNWRAELVTLPLAAAVRELQAAETTLPIERAVYSSWLSEEEKAARSTT